MIKRDLLQGTFFMISRINFCDMYHKNVILWEGK